MKMKMNDDDDDDNDMKFFLPESCGIHIYFQRG